MAKKIVAIHQPHYLPWVPYFDKILRSDQFVLLDIAQFQKNGLQNRNQIKTHNGPLWLTVPVIHAFGQTIQETKIANRQTVRKHLKTIELAYRDSPFFHEIFGLIQMPLAAEYHSLSMLNHRLLTIFLKYLGYQGDLIHASDLQVSGQGSDLILNICLALKADIYLSGVGGRCYMKLESFEQRNIQVLFQEYQNVEYPQQHSHRGFVRDLSMIDLLFNQGPESLKTIEEGRIH